MFDDDERDAELKAVDVGPTTFACVEERTVRLCFDLLSCGTGNVGPASAVKGQNGPFEDVVWDDAFKMTEQRLTMLRWRFAYYYYYYCDLLV